MEKKGMFVTLLVVVGWVDCPTMCVLFGWCTPILSRSNDKIFKKYFSNSLNLWQNRLE